MPMQGCGESPLTQCSDRGNCEHSMQAAESGAQVNLSRWDLFHAHAFSSWADGRLGLLFHAKVMTCHCTIRVLVQSSSDAVHPAHKV